MKKTIVKSSGLVEDFSKEKLKKSLTQTFNITKSPTGQTEDFIKKILADFEKWQKDKPEITSRDIRLKITRISKKYHPEASYIYDNFKKIL